MRPHRIELWTSTPLRARTISLPSASCYNQQNTKHMTVTEIGCKADKCDGRGRPALSCPARVLPGGPAPWRPPRAYPWGPATPMCQRPRRWIALPSSSILSLRTVFTWCVLFIFSVLHFLKFPQISSIFPIFRGLSMKTLICHDLRPRISAEDRTDVAPSPQNILCAHNLTNTRSDEYASSTTAKIVHVPSPTTNSSCVHSPRRKKLTHSFVHYSVRSLYITFSLEDSGCEYPPQIERKLKVNDRAQIWTREKPVFIARIFE